MEKHRKLPRAPLALFVAALAGAVLAGAWQQQANEIYLSERLQAAAERAAERLRRRMQTYEYGLLSARSAVFAAGGSAEEVSRDAFRRFGAALDMPRQYPGARGFVFISRVPAAQEAGFVAAQRRQGPADFHIRQLQPHAGERFVVQYAEPLQGNAEAVGLDIASDPVRRDNAWAALASAEPRLTPPLTLRQASGHAGSGFALLLPLYRGMVTPPPQRRELDAFGWTAVTLVMEEVLRGFNDEGGAIALALLDATPPQQPPTVFHTSAGWREPAAGDPVAVVPLPLYGRLWQLRAQPLPPFAARLNLRSPLEVAAVVAAVGALLALLLAGLQRAAQRERVIHAGRERLAAVVEGSHDAIVGHSPDDEITSWNPAAQRLLGWREEEVLGQGFTQLTVPPWLREQAHEVLERVRRGEGVPPFDTLRLNRQGQPLDVSLSVSPTHDAQGRVSGAATTLRDLREQRAAQARIVELNVTLEEQVQQRTDELRAILASAASAIVRTDLASRITLFNPAAEALLRVPAAQALGRSILDFYDEAEIQANAWRFPQVVHDNAAALPGWFRQALRSRERPSGGRPNGEPAQHGQWTYVRADGTRFPGLLNISLLRDARGRAVGFLAVIADLSERQRLERALQQRTEQAEAANRAKSAFLANMSHEIRTPLNAVIGLSHLLQQMPLQGRQREFVGHIAAAGEQLLALVNDVLDLSKIEAGEMALEHVPFELPALLRELAAQAGVQAGHKGLALRLDVDPALPARVCGDPVRLRQVLNNLLGNAVKFTEAGHVVLRAQRLADPDGSRRAALCLEVEDSGIGIAPAVQARIFEAFTQADSSTTRRFGGTGLGLSIVRRLVALMGGTLALDSEPGRGSRFTVTLALHLPD
ncbi:sensor histidine kinase [Azohydromonas lata]|uniref:histidine kinase n=1 Tax=Azohydromonas lata TaxID=45677 RepID=A0ABU5ID78_9BURK|nr:CHASE domain-containing protein [Azohydromonas lata]MDZ5457067.1 CHASE domain-containing protein [Azohydromonas lata]